MSEYEYQEETKPLSEYLSVLKRRKFEIIIPAVIVFVIALLVAFALPAKYQSKATILIEEQGIPKDFVKSTITSYAAQQVQVISQRILTVENITTIVNKFGLYQESDSNKRVPFTELAKVFRGNMNLDLVSADVIDPRSGRPTEATIAFTLAFDAESPSTAQKVTNELVTLFLNENLRTRTSQAASTSKFLTTEAGLLNKELTALEVELADFKKQNEGSLPELYQFNLSTLERTQREVSEVKFRLQELEKRKIELSAQVAQISPSAPVVLPSGEVVLSDMERLKALQSEYRTKAAIYKDTHPDVSRLKRELQSLQSELGVDANAEELKRQLQQENNKLAELKEKYKDSHFEVKNSQRVIAQLKSDISQAQRNTSSDVSTPAPDNPAYVLLDTQLKASIAEMRSLNGKKAELQQKISKYEGLLLKAPDVEKEYQSLLRDYNNATAKYQDIKAKQREASVSENLEVEQMGERFTLIEPPALPLAPESPNRPVIVLLGLILAGASGFGITLLRETLDDSIHGARELALAMGGQAPLVVIPYIENSDDLERNKSTIKFSFIAAISLGILFVFYLHFFFKPLDVLFFVILNKLGLG